MKASAVKPSYAIHLHDLVIYLLTLKNQRPDLAEKAKLAIQEGHYYERN